MNRGGVRIGTGDFYAVVEALPEIADSLVVHLEDGADGPWASSSCSCSSLPGARLDDDLAAALARATARRAFAASRARRRRRRSPAVPRTLSARSSRYR